MNKVIVSEIEAGQIADLLTVNNLGDDYTIKETMEFLERMENKKETLVSHYNLFIKVPRLMYREEKEILGLIKMFDLRKTTFTQILTIMTGMDIQKLRLKYAKNGRKIDTDYTFVFEQEVFTLPWERLYKNVLHHFEMNSGLMYDVSEFIKSSERTKMLCCAIAEDIW